MNLGDLNFVQVIRNHTVDSVQIRKCIWMFHIRM